MSFFLHRCIYLETAFPTLEVIAILSFIRLIDNSFIRSYNALRTQK